MRMIVAFKNVILQNHAQFNSRTRRAEYCRHVQAEVFISFLFGLSLVIFFAYFLRSSDDIYGIIFHGVIALLSVYFPNPNLAIKVLHLHDIGVSGWWALFGFILGSTMNLVLMLLPSKSSGGDKYGPYRDSDHARTVSKRSRPEHAL